MSVRAVAVIRPVNNPPYSPVPYQSVSQGQLEASQDHRSLDCFAIGFHADLSSSVAHRKTIDSASSWTLSKLLRTEWFVWFQAVLVLSVGLRSDSLVFFTDSAYL